MNDIEEINLYKRRAEEAEEMGILWIGRLIAVFALRYGQPLVITEAELQEAALYEVLSEAGDNLSVHRLRLRVEGQEESVLPR